jgi:hypothetical protein
MYNLRLVLLLAAVATGAYAQTAPPAASDNGKNDLTTQTAADARAEKAPLTDRNCLVDTGTHIVRKGTCVNATGRSYDRTAIKGTSMVNTAGTLEQLDPAISIRP